jgi:hypothetical protein
MVLVSNSSGLAARLIGEARAILNRRVLCVVTLLINRSLWPLSQTGRTFRSVKLTIHRIATSTLS